MRKLVWSDNRCKLYFITVHAAWGFAFLIFRWWPCSYTNSSAIRDVKSATKVEKACIVVWVWPFRANSRRILATLTARYHYKLCTLVCFWWSFYDSIWRQPVAAECQYSSNILILSVRWWELWYCNFSCDAWNWLKNSSTRVNYNLRPSMLTGSER